MGKVALKASLATAVGKIQTAGNELKVARNQELPIKSKKLGDVLAVEMGNISVIIDALIDDSGIAS